MRSRAANSIQLKSAITFTPQPLTTHTSLVHHDAGLHAGKGQGQRQDAARNEGTCHVPDILTDSGLVAWEDPRCRQATLEALGEHCRTSSSLLKTRPLGSITRFEYIFLGVRSTSHTPAVFWHLGLRVFFFLTASKVPAMKPRQHLRSRSVVSNQA